MKKTNMIHRVKLENGRWYNILGEMVTNYEGTGRTVLFATNGECLTVLAWEF